MEMSKQNPSELVVLMVPFPCHSHLNQLLRLSCLISSYDIPIHYASSATHIQQAKLRTKLEISQIIFHELPTPPFPSPPPNPNSAIKFPSHLEPCFDVALHLRRPLAELFDEICATAKKVVVVHDVLMSYSVQDIVGMKNVEVYLFHPISAFSVYMSEKQRTAPPSDLPEGLPSREGCYPPDFEKFIYLQLTVSKPHAGSLINTTRAIEGTSIDLKEKEKKPSDWRLWAIGPLNMWTLSENRKSNRRHTCLEWLEKQSPNSVIYISFGTTVSFTHAQIKELALGLEQSGQKFVWVLRGADRANIFKGDDERVELPNGYEERIKEVGMVTRDWAPQLDILGHPSVGGFMTHCGWNSCLESITMGVPMAAWPMHSDQPKNAFLVTEVFKVGLAVIRWENRNEVVSSSTIANVVKNLMASKEGEDLRNRVKDLGEAARDAVKEGGVSRKELESFVAHIKA